MLTEERFNIILKTVESKKAVTVQELTELLGSSESTVRRDLTALHEMGLINKVHGGATAVDNSYTTSEDDVAYKHGQYSEEKSVSASTRLRSLKKVTLFLLMREQLQRLSLIISVKRRRLT